MRKKTCLLLGLAALIMASTAIAGNTARKTIYAFGFAASFNDSTVYFTDIQEIDSAFIEDKSHFLAGRQDYSGQLRNYLLEKNEKNRTCIFCFDLKRKKIEKKYLKMKERYSKKGAFDVKYISTDELKFQPIIPVEQ